MAKVGRLPYDYFINIDVLLFIISFDNTIDLKTKRKDLFIAVSASRHNLYQNTSPHNLHGSGEIKKAFDSEPEKNVVKFSGSMRMFLYFFQVHHTLLEKKLFRLKISSKKFKKPFESSNENF